MMGLNRVILVGNLGKDPDVKTVGEGLVVARISLATTETFRLRNGEMHLDTQWHTVILWRALAELAKQYLRKGSLIYLEGRLKTRAYEDSRGERRFVTEIVADKFIMLDKRSSAKGADTIESLLDDSLPF